MTLADQLRISLKEDGSDANIKKWARHISEQKIAMQELLGLLDDDRYTKLRFLWMTGGLVEIDPELVYPVIPYFFAKRHEIGVPNYNRSLAKLFWLSGIPEEIEAEAIDELFNWILDAGSNTSAKSFAVLALHKLTQQYPDLKNELKLVIEDQLQKNGTSFEKRAGKVLAQL